jgi:hypothetical protein
MTMIDYLAVIGGLATAISTFFVARVNANSDRQKFYEDKISEILEIQAQEISGLKTEIQRLVTENQALTIQVSELKNQLEQRGMHYESNR